MGDIAITPANFKASDNASIIEGTAGGTTTAGDVVYKDSNGQYQRAANSSVTLAKARGYITGGHAVDQQCHVVVADDDLDPGGTAAAGVGYAVSPNAGKIGLDADVLSGKFKTPIGTGKANGNISFNLAAPDFWWGEAIA